MPHFAQDLARRLARDPEAVCRHYLSNGRREGRYWLVGDVENTPGRSLYVRLRGPETGKGAAGKWTDAATGEHGDLLDLIAANRKMDGLRETLDEARRFLSLPRPEHDPALSTPAPTGSPEAARRLFAISKSIRGSLAETYLRSRGIADLRDCTALRFHRHCYYRPGFDDHATVRSAWPAMIAAVTDANSAIVGAHRTWLDSSSGDKAPIATPRRAMGLLLGCGVRFGQPRDVLAAGEGIESTLSIQMVFPTMPAIACLSANHLAALQLPQGLQRLYVAREGDPAGRGAANRLADVATTSGIETVMLDARYDDLNEDLLRLGAQELRLRLRTQLAPVDVERFLPTRRQVALAG